MTIGNDYLPGIITDVESISTVSTSGLSDTNIAIVGDGSVAEGDATPNEPYTITRPTVVTRLFGTDTPLSDAVNDAMVEGANPVYAVMADEEDEIENITSTVGHIDEAPAVEDPDRFTFTVDNTELDVVSVLDDPADHTPDSDEAIVNAVTGKYHVPATTSAEVEYVSVDYEGALETLQVEEADVIDVVGVLAENEDVAEMVEDTVNEMESYHQFALGVVGAGTSITAASYSNPYDNSRMQLLYPTRNEDGESIMGSIVGVRGRLGITGSIMNKRIRRHSRLSYRLDEGEMIDLVAAKVTPISSETNGALVIEDMTAITDGNEDEAEMATGFARLVIDRVTETVKRTEEPFIGKLNNAATRGSLQSLIDSQLDFLLDQNAILSYEVDVRKRDADSAYVDVAVETVAPLRNIYNTVAAGRIQG